MVHGASRYLAHEDAIRSRQAQWLTSSAPQVQTAARSEQEMVLSGAMNSGLIGGVAMGASLGRPQRQ
jgi:hypothetical protein